MHGFTYMQFIVPGLIMMAVITNAYANVASSFFSAKFQRNIEELLVAPVPTTWLSPAMWAAALPAVCASGFW
jgi:ABC-2 type transport system permease protein